MPELSKLNLRWQESAWRLRGKGPLRIKKSDSTADSATVKELEFLSIVLPEPEPEGPGCTGTVKTSFPAGKLTFDHPSESQLMLIPNRESFKFRSGAGPPPGRAGPAGRGVLRKVMGAVGRPQEATPGSDSELGRSSSKTESYTESESYYQSRCIDFVQS